jgi:hypothetical protein
MELRVGTLFETPFEVGCKSLTLPDADGAFTALDSEGVECDYTITMISGFILCAYSVAHMVAEIPATESVFMGVAGDVFCCKGCADFYRRFQVTR